MNLKPSKNLLFFVAMLLIIFCLGCTAHDFQALNDTGWSPQGVQEIVESNNRFAFDFYRQINSTDENVFFSPYSISTAFAILYEGARGQTAQEISSVFGFPENDSIRRPNFAKIYNQINNPNSQYTLDTANAFWGQEDYEFVQEYLNVTRDYYGANITNLDFAGNPEESRQIINSWVSQKTRNKINKIIPQGMINDITRFVITNAIYFRGFWEKAFDASETKQEEFFVNQEKTVMVDMMRITGEDFDYAEKDGLQILEMDYKGGNLSMFVLLPTDETTLYEVEQSLSPKKFRDWLNSTQKKDVDVYLPKFTFKSDYDLIEYLKSMGMNAAFGNNSNLSGISNGFLFVSDALHKAFVSVDEVGTEAAAATTMVGVTGIMRVPVFYANHPFIFAIIQKQTGNILFFGKVVDPTQN